MSRDLFSYIDNTVIQLNKSILPEDLTIPFLHSLEKKLFKDSNGFEFVKLLHWETFPYWKNLIFKTPEDITKGLTLVSNSRSFSTQNFLFEFLLDEFLKLDIESKTNFYNKNLVTIRQDNALPVSNSVVCFNNKYLHNFNPQNTFYNLPSLFLMQYPHNTDYNKFEIICDDIKKILKLNNEQFLDKFGVGIIAVIHGSYLLKHWTDFQLDSKVELQEAFATKFYNRGFLTKEFMSYVETNKLPYDLKLPIKNNYLMTSVINSYISDVTRIINVTPFDKAKLFDIIDSSKEKINNIYKNYNMYFSKPALFSRSIKELEDRINRPFPDKEVNAKTLSFVLDVTNISSNQEYIKPKRKTKI